MALTLIISLSLNTLLIYIVKKKMKRIDELEYKYEETVMEFLYMKKGGE